MQERRLFWRKTEGTREVSFSGIPFSVEEEKILDCQYGVHYFKKHVNNGNTPSRSRLQGTRKIGCLAKVATKKYALYPEYKVGDALHSARRELKQKKQDVLEELKAALSGEPSGVKITYRYFISLPCESAHSDHPTGEPAGFAQKLHPLIISKISDMVYAGITSITEMKRSLRWYVQHDVTKQIGQMPKTTDRSLYPTDNDIRNHVHIAKKAIELSKLDQENLQLKLQKWKTDIPSQHVYYRPYVQVKKESNPSQDHDLNSEVPEQKEAQIFNGNGGVNHTSFTCLESSECSQRFLLVLQGVAEEATTKIWKHHLSDRCNL